MCGWFSAATARASRSNRSRKVGSPATVAGRILIATVRSSRVSRARYTSPMPPAPMAAMTSYGPRRVPGPRDMDWGARIVAQTRRSGGLVEQGRCAAFDRDIADRRRDDAPAVGEDLHPQPDADPPDLQEAAAES